MTKALAVLLLYVEHVSSVLRILYGIFSYLLLKLGFLASSNLRVIVHEGAHKISKILVYLHQLVQTELSHDVRVVCPLHPSSYASL